MFKACPIMKATLSAKTTCHNYPIPYLYIICGSLVLFTLDLRSFITQSVLMAFCFSVAGLISAIVAVIFIIPYHKCEDSS